MQILEPREVLHSIIMVFMMYGGENECSISTKCIFIGTFKSILNITFDE